MVDTSVLFDGNLRLPLAASAQGGHLVVYWSAAIQREMAKVTHRAAVLAMLQTAPTGWTNAALRAALRQTFDRASGYLEAQFTELERRFTLATGLASVDDAALEVVPDAADRPVLRAALATRTRFLLSLDQRDLPHGAVYHGVECWHPDTFLTLFFQQNPAAYDYAVQAMTDLPETLKRGLLRSAHR